MRRVLVLMGDGINSENELARAFTQQGAEAKKVHVNEFLKTPKMLKDFQLLAIPGGFSFGDEIRSGKILAEKMRSILSDALSEFRSQDGRIIGICNGFQVLAQLGAFDEAGNERSFTLAENNHGEFIDKWTKLTIANKTSPWMKNLEGELYLPVRHKEGRIITRAPQVELNSALIYESDINGSHHQIAGVFDKTGNIFGLMPHPEVATMSFLHPFKVGAEENANKVQQIFINGLN